MARLAPLWQPSKEAIAGSNLTRFIHFLEQRQRGTFANYNDLHRWSVAHRETFWADLWDFVGVVHSAGCREVLADGDALPGARWFEGATLNFAENLLRYDDDRTAIVSVLETGAREDISFRELRGSVASMQAALAKDGVGIGDRVAAYLPNIPETIVAMLAATSRGAIWSSCSPDFGVNGVVDRLGQIEPKLLVTVAEYQYNGKQIVLTNKLRTIAARLPSLEKIVVLRSSAVPEILTIDRTVSYEDYVGEHTRGSPTFGQLPFDHPVYIMYSSGTTGKPKCIVHGAGAVLLQHMKEHQLHTGLTRDDRLFYFTTCGWMMWNWLVSGLATGATLVLYDGSPFQGGPGRLFDLVDDVGITIFGTSAKYLASIEKVGISPIDSHDLASLRAILSTGSPLSTEGFEYVYRHIKADLHLASISGGTDIISCFVLGNPNGPVYPGEIQCPGLGMAVEVFDEGGSAMASGKGELVCTSPFPTVPLGFWNDPDGARFHDAYFAEFEGVWAHGDYMERTGRDGFVIHGRSDAVLNPGGVRIGTAEIYRQVEALPDIQESIAIGQEWQGDVRIVLFVVTKDGRDLTSSLEKDIKSTLREHASPRHVPAKVLRVDDIPRTLSGKISEIAVREVVHGRPVKNEEALANPEALEAFRDLPQLAE